MWFKMRNIVMCASFFVLILSVAACNPTAKSPREVLEKYFHLAGSGNFSEANALLCAADQDVLSKSDYLEIAKGGFNSQNLLERVKAESVFFHDFLKERLIAYEILEEREDGDNSVFLVEESSINFFAMAFEIGNTEPDLNSSELKAEDKDDLYKKAIEGLYTDEEPPREALELEISVIKEDGDWRVFVNLEDDYIEGKVFFLSQEAWTAKFDDNFKLAAELYNEALGLRPEDEVLKAGLAEVQAELDEIEEILNTPVSSYAGNYMALENIRVEKNESFTDLIFDLKNTGDKTVTKIKFRLHYLTAEGELIKAVIFDHQIWGSSLEPKSEVADQKPTYLPGEPGSWDGKSIMLTILDVEFN